MANNKEEVRIGFYVCHCGHNIAAMVDCPEVAKYVEKLPGVARVNVSAADGWTKLDIAGLRRAYEQA